jgi:lipopolysaccharide export system permease protein
MSILRKIIIKEWLAFFISATLILLTVLSLGNLLSNLMKAESSLVHVVENLIYEFPNFLVKIFPVSCLIASLFSLNKLKNRNELTAIFAGGFSRLKFVSTIAALGLLMGGILFYINSYLVPIARLKVINQSAHQNQTIVTANAINSGKIWFKGKNYFVSYASFDAKNNIIHNLSLLYFDSEFRLIEQVSGRTAKFIEGQTWKFEPFNRVTNLNNSTFPSRQTLSSSDWKIEESLQDFKKINTDITTLSIWKLYDYIKILRSNDLNDNEYYVSFLDKFSSALTCLVLSLLSAVAIFNPNRRQSSFGKSVGFVLSFTFFYWFIYSYFITLGQGSRIPAVVATFGVPMVFAIYLSFFFVYHRKLR